MSHHFFFFTSVLNNFQQAFAFSIAKNFFYSIISFPIFFSTGFIFTMTFLFLLWFMTRLKTKRKFLNLELRDAKVLTPFSSDFPPRFHSIRKKNWPTCNLQGRFDFRLFLLPTSKAPKMENHKRKLKVCNINCFSSDKCSSNYAVKNRLVSSVQKSYHDYRAVQTNGFTMVRPSFTYCLLSTLLLAQLMCDDVSKKYNC